MSRVVIVLIATLFGLPAWSRADPIHITGGLFTGSDGSVNDFEMAGRAIRLSGIAGSDAFGEPHWRCGLCQPGAQLDLSSRYESFESIQWNGTTYENVTGFFSFVSDPVTVPGLGAGESTRVTRPFTFQGRLIGLGPAGFLDLLGSGSATVSLLGRAPTSSEPGHVDATLTRYRFEETPAPVPEPATLFLAGAGLAGLLTRQRRRRRTAQIATEGCAQAQG